MQLSMVQAMSKVLEFSEEECKTLGLDGGKGLLSKPEKPQRGFRQSLISFMMNEDDD